MNNTTSKLLGISDETHVCDCCGKQNLKRVAIIELADGSIVRYGRDCAARELGKKFVNQIDQMIDVKAYIAKWEQKYSGEIVAKGLTEKRGLYTKFIDGKYHVNGLGVI